MTIMANHHFCRLIVAVWCIFMHLEGSEAQVDVQFVNFDVRKSHKFITHSHVVLTPYSSTV